MKLTLAALGALFLSNAAFAGVCPVYDYDLGSTIGLAASNYTCNEGNDESSSCGGAGASQDISFRWQAPAAGDWTFDTLGSTYDTVLHAKDMTSCTELVCNDDTYSLKSAITLNLAQGDEIFLVVDGYSTFSCGYFNLHIQSGPCPDSDRDGICDDVEVCFGDDASGDDDFDATCNDVDFMLRARTGAGQPIDLSVTGAPPGEMILFLGSSATGFACHPSGQPCVDLNRPMVLGTAQANNNGEASLQVPAPARPPRQLNFQALWFDLPNESDDTTNVASIP
jgi:hypothetical protein